MPHIHTDPYQHDLTVSAYIVRIDTSEPQVLLHKHRKLNKLMAVGGHVELSETPWQALAHELTEESGYTLDQLDVLQPRSRIKQLTGVAQHLYPISLNTHAIPGEHFHTDIQYAFVATGDPSSPVSDGESQDLQWLTHNELEALTEDEVFANTKEIYGFILDEALREWEKVSTATFTR